MFCVIAGAVFNSLYWVILTSHVFVNLFFIFCFFSPFVISSVSYLWCLISLCVLDIVFAELF